MTDCTQCQKITEQPNRDWAETTLVEASSLPRTFIGAKSQGYECTECEQHWNRHELTARPWTVTWQRQT